MWKYPTNYDVIVVGAGHSGCEAAHAAAKLGSKTLLLTMNLDTIAKASCNPSIGGVGKGTIVREIDALGGLMGKIADKTAIHTRMLNSSKGAAVRAPRAQIDKAKYSIEMKKTLEETANLEIKQLTVEELIVENDKVVGLKTLEGILFHSKTIIITSGTFMKGLIHIGDVNFSAGRSGDLSSNISNSLKSIGIRLDRLKTGTPPRIHKRSIDFSILEKQSSEENVKFSFDDIKQSLNHQIPCYISYTTEQTKEIILKDIKKSAMYSGKITSKGPRYCPSIEDKIVRFEKKLRHQTFLEPEGLDTNEYYLNGMSTSLPFSTQLAFIRSIEGLENAEITRPAYAIEYDYIPSFQIHPSMESKKIDGLYFAGQINGTTGYEEAAAQGLIAGINASNKVFLKQEFILKREEAYIGVMIDDLMTKEILEPYRMFTSRAEFRLYLRQDNADLRLREYGFQLGLIDKEKYSKLNEKKETIKNQISKLLKASTIENDKKISLKNLISRPENSYLKIIKDHNLENFSNDINEQIELEIKYEGYISRQKKEIKKFLNLNKIKIPKNFDYKKIIGLRSEAREKLIKFSPENLEIASKINGVNFGDLSILIITLQKSPLKNIK